MTSGGRSFHCNNHNAFLGMMQEALSGKTGFTNNAGYCYVGAVTSEGRTFTVALLACGWPNNRSYKWSDMKKLAAYGMEHYQYRDLYENKEFQAIPVINGITGEQGTPYEKVSVPVVLEDHEETLPYLLGEEDRVDVKTQVAKTLTAPIEDHTEVGEVSYYLNGQLIKRYAVYTKGAVEERSFGWICRYIWRIFLP